MVEWKDIATVCEHLLISRAMKGAFNTRPHYLATTPGMWDGITPRQTVRK